MESVNPVEIGGNARKFLTGPRLAELNKEFEQNGGEWKEFKIGELFDIVKGKRLTKENIKPGNINFLGAISSNNGIRERIETTTVWKPNCISVNYNGSVGCSFYQEEPFYASDDVNICYSKENWILNRKRALFFCAVFKNFSQKFSYTQKWNKERMEKSRVLLPTTPDGTPDFSYMERYIGELEQARAGELEQERDSELAAYLRAAGLENYDLTAAEQTALDDFKNNRLNFKEFKIGELFDVSTPKRKFNANSVKFGGRFPYVVRTSLNNGIRDFLDEDESFLNPAGTISFGQDTATIFYQEKPYFTGDKIKILRFKLLGLNEKIANFMLTLMRKSFSGFQWGQSSFNEKVLKNVVIELPVTNGTPDFAFMESFVTAQQKLAIRDVVLWKDKVISKTLEVINIDF